MRTRKYFNPAGWAKRSAAVIVALVIGGSLAVAAPAQAGSEDGVINWGEFVMWEHRDRFGCIFDEYYNLDNYEWRWFVNCGLQLNDNVSSMRNYDQNYALYVHEHAYRGGPRMSVLRYGQAADGASWGYSYVGDYFNDRLSSHYFY